MADVHAAMGLRADEVSRVLNAAAKAPSVHNTQPWSFRLTPDAIELHGDPERRLAVADPDGIELRMSCGAALFNMRLELSQLGVRPEVTIFPDASQPHLLATIRSAGPRQASPEETALARAIARRHTNRRSFTDEAVTSAHRHNLVRAAQQQGAHLHVVDDPGRRVQLGRLSTRAHEVQTRDPRFRAELAEWSGGSGRPAEGVPARAGGPAPHGTEAWVLRDFTGDHRPEPTGHTRYEANPLIAVLSMYTTGPGADVRAGEALQRVLLTATTDGLSASLISQLVEVAEMREQARELVGAGYPPHAVLRIGYGWPVGGTPRRAVEELVSSGPERRPPSDTDRGA